MKGKFSRSIFSVLIAVIMLLSMSQAAFAATSENRTPVSTVYFTVVNNSTSGSIKYPNIVLDGEGFFIEGEIAWSVSESNLKTLSPNSDLTATFTLKARPNYYFNQSNFGVDVSNDDVFITYKVVDDMHVSVKLRTKAGAVVPTPAPTPVPTPEPTPSPTPVPRYYLDKVSFKSFNGTSIRWNQVSHADYYIVRLYTASNWEYIFYDTTTGTEYKLGEIQKFLPDRFYGTDLNCSVVAVSYQDRYLDSDPSYFGTFKVNRISPSNMDYHPEYLNFSWKESSGYYYFTNGNEYVNGWIWYENNWYYADDNYRRVTGWLQLGNNWYYFFGDGRMAHDGWIQSSNGKYYYLYSDGIMATNTWIGQYHVNGEGAWDMTDTNRR